MFPMKWPILRHTHLLGVSLHFGPYKLFNHGIPDWKITATVIQFLICDNANQICDNAHVRGTLLYNVSRSHPGTAGFTILCYHLEVCLKHACTLVKFIMCCNDVIHSPSIKHAQWHSESHPMENFTSSRWQIHCIHWSHCFQCNLDHWSHGKPSIPWLGRSALRWDLCARMGPKIATKEGN